MEPLTQPTEPLLLLLHSCHSILPGARRMLAHIVTTTPCQLCLAIPLGFPPLPSPWSQPACFPGLLLRPLPALPASALSPQPLLSQPPCPCEVEHEVSRGALFPRVESSVSEMFLCSLRVPASPTAPPLLAHSQAWLLLPPHCQALDCPRIFAQVAPSLLGFSLFVRGPSANSWAL